MRIDDGVGSDIEVNHLDKPDGIWLSVSGEIDASNAAFADGLHGVIADSGRPVVLDFADVTFMDSSGIRELHRCPRSAGSRLRVAALHRSVRRILELASLLDQFEPFADGDDPPASGVTSTGRAERCLAPTSGDSRWIGSVGRCSQ